MRLKFGFVAPASKAFGVVLPLVDQVLALPNPIDVWLPEDNTQNYGLVDGRVAEWRGRINNRILGQTVAARRPIPEGGQLRFSSPVQAAAAQLDLTGAAIGERSAITIAVKARIHAEQLSVDNQYFWGSSVAGAMSRIAYRFTNGTRYMRYQTNDNSFSMDVPLPAEWSGAIGVVVVISGLTLTMYLSNGSSNTRALTVPFNMQGLSVGNAVAAQAGNLRGYLGPFGIWTRAVTESERNMLLQWVA